MAARLDDSPVATYEFESDESVLDGLLRVFDAIGYDLSEKEPTLLAFIDPGAVERLRDRNTRFNLIVTIWGHPVEITPDKIRIYDNDEAQMIEV